MIVKLHVEDRWPTLKHLELCPCLTKRSLPSVLPRTCNTYSEEPAPDASNAASLTANMQAPPPKIFPQRNLSGCIEVNRVPRLRDHRSSTFLPQENHFPWDGKNQNRRMHAGQAVRSGAGRRWGRRPHRRRRPARGAPPRRWAFHSSPLSKDFSRTEYNNMSKYNIFVDICI